MIAALFVESGGAYFGQPDIDPWDAERDARLYRGPHPVIAHPPCSRWCQLAALVEARHGHKRGEDDGCFAAALAAVREFGGVIEHPAYSKAWDAFGLPKPPAKGGWQRGVCGGWTTHVEQGQYGHAARKATWLYAHGVKHLPPLRWGRGPRPERLVGYCRNHSPGDTRLGLSQKEASATPAAFRAVLLDLARSCGRG